jgi:hypothetical protein
LRKQRVCTENIYLLRTIPRPCNFPIAELLKVRHVCAVTPLIRFLFLVVAANLDVELESREAIHDPA